MFYYPPRQAPATAKRRATNARSFRGACVAAGYSIAMTQAALETANRRRIAGLAIVWPNA
jgi:hypothetical protein